MQYMVSQESGIFKGLNSLNWKTDILDPLLGDNLSLSRIGRNK